MTYSTLSIDRSGAAEWLTLDRPQRLNAIDSVMAGELTRYFQDIAARPDVRIVVLRGAGRGFCAGVDVKEAFSAPEAERWGDAGIVRELAIQKANRDYILAMRACPQPIISLLHGAVCGAGLGLALASDVRLASRCAALNCAFVQIGLGGCDIGVSYFLPRMVGLSVATELMLTGLPIDAERGRELGLINRLVETSGELFDAVVPMLEAMLAVSPTALRLSKDALRFSIDAQSLEAVIAMEDRNQVLCARTDDFHEAVRAFQERREPVWGDR